MTHLSEPYSIDHLASELKKCNKTMGEPNGVLVTWTM